MWVKLFGGHSLITIKKSFSPKQKNDSLKNEKSDLFYSSVGLKKYTIGSIPVESYEKGLAFLVAKNYKRLKIIP